MSKKADVPVKIPESVLPGVYSNQMMVSHTREEFLLDFVNVFPPQSIVTARVFVSPVQIKRMIAALDQEERLAEAFIASSTRKKSVPIPNLTLWSYQNCR